MIRTGLISGLFLVWAAMSAVAGTFEDGHTAYMRGDYERSIALLRGPADSGNPAAAYIVGRQYQLGQGVETDFAKAWYWYRRAEAKGHVEAGLFRHLLVTKWKMSKADLARARARYAASTTRTEDKPVPASTAETAPTENTATETAPAAPRGRIALAPSVRPDIEPAAVATVSVRPRKVVRVTELGPSAPPTRAVARTAPAKPKPGNTPSETALRSDRDERCTWCGSIEPRSRTPESREEEIVGTEDEYDTAVEPDYDPSPDQPVWRPAPPAPVIAPGYWRYRAWQRSRASRRRAWRGPPPGRGWRHRAWRRPGWHRY